MGGGGEFKKRHVHSKGKPSHYTLVNPLLPTNLTRTRRTIVELIPWEFCFICIVWGTVNNNYPISFLFHYQHSKYTIGIELKHFQDQQQWYQRCCWYGWEGARTVAILLWLFGGVTAFYDDELLGPRGHKVYNPLHHKLWWGVYYDTVSKRIYRVVFRRLSDGENTVNLGNEGHIETGLIMMQRLCK